MNIDKYTCGVLRKEVEAALAPVLAKHKMTAHLGRGTFDPGVEFRMKLTIMQDEPIRKEVHLVNDPFTIPGTPKMPSLTSGAEIRFMGKSYYYVGRLPGGRKYHHTVQNAAGKKYKMTDMQVRIGLVKKDTING